jgi:uncharacterized protein (UPF0332 family)
MMQEFLQKAQENLDDARVAFEQGRYNAVANRAYYASFQAAISALAAEGLKKKGHPHDWVQAQFSGVLIRQRKLYSSALKSHLVDMLKVRERADYTESMISKSQALIQLKQATEMVASIVERIQAHDTQS